MDEKTSPAITTDSPPPSMAEQQSSRRRGGALKRKASNLNSSASTPPPSSSSKRQTREKPSPVLFGPIHNGPLTRARLQPNYADPTGFWDAVIVNGDGENSMVPVTPVSAKAEEELIARRLVWEALEAKIESEFDELKSSDANSHFVPICSGWFSWTKVHPLEERALPSFFNGKFEKRTPDVYMEIRNSIIKIFHANPRTQIEEKELSEVPVGESDAKKEVMEFLDYWGLINYHPFPEADVANSVDEHEEAAKVNSLIQKLYEFEVEQLCSPAAPRSSYTMPVVSSRLPESMITDESVQPEGPSVEYHCNSCAADCSRKRYHCQKQADYDLCTECFKEGKFDSDMAPSDFILMEPGDAATGANSGKWTDQETLLLLEALDLFSENWNEIAEHVATKTKAQCILHFIQMPIEDTFQDCGDEEDIASHKENAEKKDASPDDEVKKEIDGNLKENAEKAKEDVNMMEMDVSDPADTKETEDPKALLKNGDDAPSNNDQSDSAPMEISESVDINNKSNNNNKQENGENFAAKALREAFEAVGSPSVDEKFSFVDAGNPVMTVAAFLTRLVEPNIVTASARTSLKSVSSGGSGLQLSARHSFVLEDPVDDKKKVDDSERDVEEVVEQEDLKEKTDLVNYHNKEEGTDVIINKKEKVLDSIEKKDPITVDVTVSKKGKNAGTKRKGSSKKDKVPVTEKPVISAETNEQTKVENTSISKKESKDSVEGVSVTPLEAPKHEEMVEKADPPRSAVAESTPNSGEAGTKECINVNKPSLDTKDDPNAHNLTRAAVSAISAAAVKAKLLADQEEDSIRQLATSLIEKQLRKLETKLSFFIEMDGVVTRAREQLERSKQRLYHERAQIIAARLGMSGNPNRPMQNPSPNRAGATAVQRPPNAMNTPQRPPLSRPMMVGPTPVAGNTAQIPNNQAMK